MKKLSLTLLCAVTLMTSASAQYFQHLYAGTGFADMTWGMNTHSSYNPQGHFMVGAASGATPVTGEEIIGTFTDVNGGIPSGPYFNNVYTINGSYKFNTYTVRGFEYSGGLGSGGFGIVGNYMVPPPPILGYRIFLLRLDGGGNVLGASSYSSGTITGNLTVQGISKSASGNEIYITGLAESGSQTDPYAMKIDIATGAVIWSKVYNLALLGTRVDAAAADIVESPYTPGGVAEAVIVGSAGTGTATQGFILRVNAGTGNAIVSARSFGDPAVNDFFTGITVANSPFGGTGFAVCGGSSTTYGKLWLMKTNQTGNSTIWSNLFDDANSPGTGLISSDVIERNNGGTYTYFAGGGTFVGNGQACVIKTDQAGIGLSQFVYGTGTDPYYCRSLDQYSNGLPYDGLSMFCEYNTLGGGYYMDHIKAYFNGITPCKQTITNPVFNTGPGGPTTVYAITTQAGPTQGTLSIDLVESGIDVPLCYANTVPTGSNARLLAAEETATATLLYPNPASTTRAVNISIYSDLDEEVQIVFTDILGRQVFRHSYAVTEGANNLAIDMADLHLSAGIYNVSIHKSTATETIRLAVQQ